VLRTYREEMLVTLGLTGVTNVDQLDASILVDT